MGERRIERYIIKTQALPLEKRLEREQFGLWTIYQLENGIMPIVDEINAPKILLDEIKTGYYHGVKIKEKLASANYYFRALQIWELLQVKNKRS